MEELISTYGYPAITLGTFFEGETIVLVAGYLASRDYLVLQWVVVCAFLGSWAGDSLYFFIGRRWGDKLLARRPAWRPAADRALVMLHRYHAIFILSFRFLYGLRTISPFVIGMSKVSTPRFLALNLLASVIWATIFSIAGYTLGTVLAAMIKKIEHYEALGLVVVAAVGLVIWFIRVWLTRRRRPIEPALRVAPVEPDKTERQSDAR
jgi:membrane protein DedA with SNARE-associated domain